METMNAKVLDEPVWAVTAEKVKMAVQRIIEAGRPKRLILFGSYVTGKTTRNSDLDVLVVIDNDTVNTREESVRIRKALRGILMPVDILVVSSKKLAELSNVPGMIYREALRNGEVVYESSE